MLRGCGLLLAETAFLPRDAMSKQGAAAYAAIPSRGVRPSVCLSVCPSILSKRVNTVSIFLPPGPLAGQK